MDNGPELASKSKVEWAENQEIELASIHQANQFKMHILNVSTVTGKSLDLLQPSKTEQVPEAIDPSIG